jgi:RNA polymerase sigma-70 factor (ECF subfamily)
VSGPSDELTRLALAAAAGDATAREAFVRGSQVDVWRLCSHLGGRDEADDLTQDAYARILPALPSFRGESSARTWVLSITRRVCADHVRGLTRRRLLQARIEGQRRPTFTADPSGRVDVHLLVASLVPEQQDAFVLTQVLGLSYEETATVCGCPVGTVRSRVARAREALVGHLRQRPAVDE